MTPGTLTTPDCPDLSPGGGSGSGSASDSSVTLYNTYCEDGIWTTYSFELSIVNGLPVLGEETFYAYGGCCGCAADEVPACDAVTGDLCAIVRFPGATGVCSCYDGSEWTFTYLGGGAWAGAPNDPGACDFGTSPGLELLCSAGQWTLNPDVNYDCVIVQQYPISSSTDPFRLVFAWTALSGEGCEGCTGVNYIEITECSSGGSGGGSGSEGPFSTCCGRNMSPTLYASISGGFGTATLTWDGTLYWIGTKYLASCGTTIHLRFSQPCAVVKSTLQFSLDLVNWSFATGFTNNVTCGPPYTAGTWTFDLTSLGCGVITIDISE